MKNELVIARYIGDSAKAQAAAVRLRALLTEFGLGALLESRFRLRDQ